MARDLRDDLVGDLGDWDPRLEDFMGVERGGRGGWRGGAVHHLPSHLPPPQLSPLLPPNRTVGRRPRGLYVKNIPSTMNADNLRRLFSEFGRVESVVMGRVRADSPKPRWAIVNPCSTRDGLEMLSALNRRPPLCLSVSPAISPEEKRRRDREREEEERFFEEVRKEAQAARSKDVTPVVKGDRGDVNTTASTTFASDMTTTITTTTTSTTTTTTTTTITATITTSASVITTALATISSPSVNNTTVTTTTSTSTSTSTAHTKISQTPFEVSQGTVEVSHRPAEPCLKCGALGRMVCSVCGAWYCGKVCQEAHWPTHENACAAANPSPPTGVDNHPSPVSAKVQEGFTKD